MWYLMSAYSLTEKKRASLDEVFKHWDEGTIFVVSTGTGKKMFAVSSSSWGNCAVGWQVEWTKDTGLGHVNPSYDDRRLTIENVIEYGPCVATGKPTILNKANNIGLNESRAIYVFK